MTTRPERITWNLWLDDELTEYTDKKFDHLRPGHDEQLIDSGCGKDSYWFGQVMQYPQRASVLGLDSLGGRQALLKGLAAYVGLVESAIRVHGSPPAGGVPSGEIVDCDY